MSDVTTYIFGLTSRLLLKLLSTANSQLVWETMKALEDLEQRNRVTSVWVPGHMGIQGNKTVDRLTKKEAQDDTEIRPVGVPFITGLNQIESGFQQEHLRHWKDKKACKTVRVTMPELSKKKTTQLISMNRRKLRTTIILLTGHGLFKFHSKTIAIGADGTPVGSARIWRTVYTCAIVQL